MSNIKILIVDDEENIARTIAMTLRGQGYETATCQDGEIAWKKIGEEVWDVIFLDLRIPGLNGLELMKLIHDHSITSKVVMMTAFGTVDNAVLAMKYGAADFIQKPFDPADLVSIVKNILSRPSLLEKDLSSYAEFIELAKLRIQNRDFRGARQAVEKALENNPGAAEAYNLLGGIYEAMNEPVNASQAYQMALKFDKDFRPAAENLQRMLSLESNFAGVFDIMQVLSRDPDNGQ